MGARKLKEYENIYNTQTYTPQDVIYIKPRRTRPEPKVLERPKANVRPAGKVSPMAIIAFLLLGICSVTMLRKNVDLLMLQEENVQLQNQVAQLEARERALLIECQEKCDHEIAEGTIIFQDITGKPLNAQTVFLDLSEPDSLVVYDTEAKWYSWILDLLQ